MALTAMQKRIIANYNGNMAEAVRKAGSANKNPGAYGFQLQQVPEFREALEAKMKKPLTSAIWSVAQIQEAWTKKIKENMHLDIAENPQAWAVIKGMMDSLARSQAAFMDNLNLSAKITINVSAIEKPAGAGIADDDDIIEITGKNDKECKK